INGQKLKNYGQKLKNYGQELENREKEFNVFKLEMQYQTSNTLLTDEVVGTNPMI
uniref:Uncharacterized protein n=1 Tax=Acrobeloides nanus TaxID=290746 RepID=A0A914DPT1_9BILA